MRNTVFIIIIAIILAFSLPKVFALSKKEVEKKKITKIEALKKKETDQIKPVRCGNCPNNCLIKPNKTGDCGQYQNVGGKIVPKD